MNNNIKKLIMLSGLFAIEAHIFGTNPGNLDNSIQKTTKFLKKEHPNICKEFKASDELKRMKMVIDAAVQITQNKLDGGEVTVDMESFKEPLEVITVLIAALNEDEFQERNSKCFELTKESQRLIDKAIRSDIGWKVGQITSSRNSEALDNKVLDPENHLTYWETISKYFGW